MNYSQTVIANMALGKIGARGSITSVTENSPNAKKVLAVWDVVLAEVLAERDWKFAKTRVELQKVPQTPLYGYQYAWVLPSDFIRFVRPHKRPIDQSLMAWMWSPEGYGWYNISDPPLWPTGWPYVVESVQTGTTIDTSGATTPDYTQCVLCDYPGDWGAARINYIRLITDLTKLQPGFVNCFVYRLAAEISIGVTEDMQKAQSMMSMYRDTLNSAEAQNETMDFQLDETGSDAWVRAGRWGYNGR